MAAEDKSSPLHRRVPQEIWDRRNTEVPVRSAEALVTLASIVEKETAGARLVASRASACQSHNG
jgi:hypothetical protein